MVFSLRELWCLWLVLATAISGGCMSYVPSQTAPAQTTPGNSTSDQASATELSNSEELCERLDRTLRSVLYQRHLNAREHAAWQVMHGVLAYGRAFPLDVDGRSVSALQYLLDGGALAGWEFEPGDAVNPLTGGRGLRAVLAPGSRSGQGHPDQWLGYLATCGIPLQQPIRIGSETFTLADLVYQVEWDVPRNAAREYSWTLMGLSSYRPSHHTWQASDGQTWSLERLVAEELQHDRDSSACGGTHRLYALAMALNRHLAQGGRLEGAWAEADQKIQEAVQRARDFQNPDGTFSAHYFARPGTTSDAAQRLATTGHVLEFLVMALTQDQLEEPWLRRAALSLCDTLTLTQSVPLDCGALYHAVHGLVLYRERLFGPLHLELPYLQSGSP